MSLTPQNLCGYLIRSRLMAPEDTRGMFQRWLTEAKENAANLAQFTKWLVAHDYVTDYQAALLAKGHKDPNVFFLDQYKIMDRLGRGRMAGVYKALHTLGQTVAIKVLPPSRAKDAKMLARFQREARLALQLKHPNVVRSFQIGLANNLHYLVMEYLEGETLEEVLNRRKRLPPGEAVRLIHQALTGLQHIHELGLVHRDLKPANFMLVPAPAQGEPDTTLRAAMKILDIGLGRALFDENAPVDDEEIELTAEGMILGTPDYLAPEQARDPRGIDVRADIYSLGCVLFHLLTGQTPFPGTNLIKQMVRHATEAPKPLQQFNPAIPDGLQQIVNYMMAKEAAQRYPTPERAAQALQMFLMAEGQVAGPIEEAPQMRKYLTWLETAPSEPEASAASVPVAQNLANVAVVQPRPSSPELAPPAPGSSKPSASHGKKHRKHQRPKHVHVPTAQPAAPRAGSTDFDVELVPMDAIPAGTRPPGSAGHKTLGLTKREWLLVGIGAGALTVAVIIGVVIYALL